MVFALGSLMKNMPTALTLREDALTLVDALGFTIENIAKRVLSQTVNNAGCPKWKGKERFVISRRVLL